MKKKPNCIIACISSSSSTRPCRIILPFSQNVLIGSTETETTGATTNGKSVSDVNTTRVNLSATLNFGKLMVDGVIGTDSPANGANTGRLNLDQVMTRVGVHYWF